MDNSRKPSSLKTWRDKIPPPPLTTPIETQDPKEPLEKILEDGFKQDMKNLKTGCLVSYHVGCLALAALVFLVGILTIWNIIFGE